MPLGSAHLRLARRDGGREREEGKGIGRKCRFYFPHRTPGSAAGGVTRRFFTAADDFTYLRPSQSKASAVIAIQALSL